MKATKFIRTVKLIIGVTILFINYSVNGQNNENPLGTLFNNIPNPPNVASFEKFTNIPITYATGIPQINIPIYQYQSNNGNITVNVSLDYHAGGVKVGEKSSNIGLGWSLNTGGVITRTAMGRDDDVGGYWSLPLIADYYNNVQCDVDCESNKLYKYNKGLEDSEPDVFSFSFNGRSGKFVIGKNNEVFLFPQQNLDIQCIKNAGGVISGFSITDENGTKYYYSEKDNISVDARFTTKSWYLTKISSVLQTDSILFKYKRISQSYAFVKDRTIFFDFNNQRRSEILSKINDNNNYDYTSMTVPVLEEIEFPNEVTVKVLFAETNRCDINGDKAVSSIMVRSQENTVFYNLIQDYFPKNSLTGECGTNTDDQKASIRMILKEVRKSTNKGSENPYQFEYYNIDELPSSLSLAQDHWGYYNGAINNKSLVPNLYGMTMPNAFNIVNADRRVNPEFIRYGSLKKIIYPTGGYTEFELEANDTKMGITVQENPNAVKRYAGGLRVKKITQYDGVNHANDLVRTYNYTYSDGTSSGVLMVQPNYSDDYSYQENGSGNCFGETSTSITANFTIINSSSIYNLSTFLGSPIFYEQVEENIINTSNQLNGKIERRFTSVNDLSAISFPRFIPNFPYKPLVFPDWSLGLLKSETIYNSEGQKVKK